MPRGVYIRTDRYRKKMSQSLKGRIHTSETKKKISLSHIGKKHLEKSKNKISVAHKGKHHSPKTEFRKGQVSWNKGKKFGKITRYKMSEANIKRFIEANGIDRSKYSYYRRLKRNFNQYKFAAKKRGIPFKLYIEEFETYWEKPCSYCGDTIINSVRLDRVNNLYGYIKGNVVSCCKLCNIMKTNLSVEAFLAHIKKIDLHTGKQFP